MTEAHGVATVTCRPVVEPVRAAPAPTTPQGCSREQRSSPCAPRGADRRTDGAPLRRRAPAQRRPARPQLSSVSAAYTGSSLVAGTPTAIARCTPGFASASRGGLTASPTTPCERADARATPPASSAATERDLRRCAGGGGPLRRRNGHERRNRTVRNAAQRHGDHHLTQDATARSYTDARHRSGRTGARRS